MSVYFSRSQEKSEDTLESDYRFHLNGLDRLGWDHVLGQFDDANIYQSWAYGKAKWSEKELNHFVLTHQGDVIAAAQLRIVRFPIVGRGIAYIRWGPMWQSKDRPSSPDTLKRFVDGLVQEFVVRQRMLLRVLPPTFKDTQHEKYFQNAFNTFKVEEIPDGSTYRTILLSTTRPLDEIRKSLLSKWRNQLNRAERNDLEIVRGTEDEYFEVFSKMYREMLSRKRIPDYSGFDAYREMQQLLPRKAKLNVTLCYQDSEPVAGAITTQMGNSAIYLLGATSDMGLEAKGSYLVQWSIIEQLVNDRVTWYNLGGINPDTNRGVYIFKRGFNGDDLLYSLPMSRCDSKVTSFMASTAIKGRDLLRRFKSR